MLRARPVRSETEELRERSEALVQCSDGSYAATLDECLLEPDGSCPSPPPIRI
jgi:hypothetical protein